LDFLDNGKIVLQPHSRSSSALWLDDDISSSSNQNLACSAFRAVFRLRVGNGARNFLGNFLAGLPLAPGFSEGGGGPFSVDNFSSFLQFINRARSFAIENLNPPINFYLHPLSEVFS
jgi:hypothetical protein